MKEKSCGAIPFMLQDGRIKYLLVQHNDASGGHWSFPKGHVESGKDKKRETEEETAVREVFEETGLEVGLLDIKETITYECRPGVFKEVVFFIGHVSSPEVRLQKEELQDHAWLEFDAAIDRLTFENTKEVLRKADAYLREIYS